MIFISHRGNLDGRIPERENDPKYIDEAIEAGFDVEVDIYLIAAGYYLGHDEPKYEIRLEWLFNRSKSLWCHAKNLWALSDLINYQRLNVFWHQNDMYTLTSNNDIWTYPGGHLTNKSISLKTEKHEPIDLHVYGICSDYIKHYRDVVNILWNET